MYGHVAKPKKVAVITRWPYYGGGRKAGFHCKLDGLFFYYFYRTYESHVGAKSKRRDTNFNSQSAINIVEDYY